MAWRDLTAEEILNRLAPAERSGLDGVQDRQSSVTILEEHLNDSKRTFLAAIQNAGFEIADDGRVPDSIRQYIMAHARWMWLIDFPKSVFMQTEERKQAWQKAEDLLVSIRKREVPIEPVVFNTLGTISSTWNSRNKLIMRTDPTPSPLLQTQQVSVVGYANPNAPGDVVPNDSPGMPAQVDGLKVEHADDGVVLLSWAPSRNAYSYSVFRGDAPTKQMLTPIADKIAENYFEDSGLTNGSTYFYVVIAYNVNGLPSALSKEVSANVKEGVLP